jgi:hypothetical protein
VVEAWLTMNADERQDPAEREVGRPLRGAARIALFAEVLLTGGVLAILSIPVVTVVPALAGGAVHLRRHLDGRPDSLRDLLRHVGVALRALWPLGLVVPALLLLLAFDLWLVGTGALPGGAVVGVGVAVVAAAVVVLVLRLAATWAAGSPVGRSVREAGRVSAADLSGSLLLLAAVAVVGVVVWMFVPFLFVAPGLLAFAAVAVEQRRTSWRRGEHVDGPG